MALTPLFTVRAVIKELGGPTRVAELSEVGRANVVWNWGDRGKIPPQFRDRHLAILHSKGFDAPSSLWGMVAPAEEERAG